MIKVALDAMGGDNAPGEIVKGAVDAVNTSKECFVYLVGKEDVVNNELSKYTYSKEQIEVVNATEVIEAGEPPVMAIRHKKDSSLVKALNMVKNKEADYGVLPIENSTTGSVVGVYDLLQEYDNYIIAETFVNIDHVLVGLKGTDINKVTTVYSHPQGIMQCDHFLNTHKDWQRIHQANTAMAAKMLLSENDHTHVAISSKKAAQIYGLEVLETGIADLSNNTTRFVIITNERRFLKNANKTSIVFETANEAGTLYNLLSHIIYNGLNMYKIESRPADKQWDYKFFVDFEGNIDDPRVMNALRGIQEEAKSIKLLGNY